MKQFGKIFKFELKYYLKNKIFVGITLFLVILIGLVMFFPRVMTALGKEQGEVELDRPVLLVKPDAPENSDVVKEIFAASKMRDGIVVAEDEIASLKRFKDDAKEVAEGFECGVTLEKFGDVKEGDVYEAFKLEEYRD